MTWRQGLALIYLGLPKAPCLKQSRDSEYMIWIKWQCFRSLPTLANDSHLSWDWFSCFIISNEMAVFKNMEESNDYFIIPKINKTKIRCICLHWLQSSACKMIFFSPFSRNFESQLFYWMQGWAEDPSITQPGAVGVIDYSFKEGRSSVPFHYFPVAIF